VSGRRSTRSNTPVVLAVLALMAALIVAATVNAPSFRAAAKRRQAAAPVASVASTTAAPASEPTATTVVHRAVPVVAVVGDSLSYSAATALDAALRAAGGDPVLRVAPGRRIPVWGLDGQISPGLDEAKQLRSSAPAVWVVQLGTNDIAAEPVDPARYRELVTTMLETIGADVPVVWVNVHRGDRPEASRTFDDTLRQVARSWPNLTIADWDAVADHEQVLAADGIHLGGTGGADRFVQTIALAVRRAGSAAGALP
jgi:GDSL-like lipase/acylhydrolase family protein